LPEIPGFHVKYAGIEVEFWSHDSTTVANRYRELLAWLQDIIQKTLDQMQSDIRLLKKDIAEIKQLRKEV